MKTRLPVRHRHKRHDQAAHALHHVTPGLCLYVTPREIDALAALILPVVVLIGHLLKWWRKKSGKH